MPLLYHDWVNKGLQLGLWQISESAEELISLLFLNKEEFDTLESYKSISRRKQWLSYRALIRHMVKTDFIYRIHYDKHKKPFLVNPQRSISVSHCNSYSAVLISDNLDINHGIDVEPIKPKILKVIDRFLNPSEEEEWNKDKNLTKAVAYWSMKEAIFKAYGKSGLTLKESIRIEPFDIYTKESIKGYIDDNNSTTAYYLHFRQFNGLMIAIAFDRKLK